MVTGILTLLILAIITYISIIGRIVPGTPWSMVDKDGPLLLGNQHALTLKRCAIISGFMSKGPCEVAFVDHKKRKVAWNNIREKIDAHLNSIPEFEPWVSIAREDSSSCMAYRREVRCRIPYKLNLLTISPMVVLATPYSNKMRLYCRGPPEGGCISGRSHNSYFYRGSIDVIPESLIFFPEEPFGVVPIPNDTQHFEIQLPDSSLILDAENGQWKVSRNAGNR